MRAPRCWRAATPRGAATSSRATPRARARRTETLPALAPLPFALGLGAAFAAALALATLRPALVSDWPRSVLAALLAVTLAAGLALVRFDPPGLRLEIDPSTEPLLPAHDPANASYRRAVADFGADEVFVIAAETEDVFSAASLARLERISARIAALPGVRRVESLVNAPSFRYVPEEDWIEVKPFLDGAPRDAAGLAALRERALRDPLYRKSIVSADGRSAALNVQFEEMSDRAFIAADLDGKIRAILAEEEAPGVRFHVAGRPHAKSQVYHLLRRDLLLLVPAAVAAAGLVLWLAFGTLRGVALPLAAALMATEWTFGAFALLGRPLTILTSLLGPTLVAIASVYGVHVVARFEEEHAVEHDTRAAARACAEHLRAPVLIAGTTTLIGFAALLLTDVPAVFELGAFSLLGVAAITLISLCGIPAALALLPQRRPDADDPHAHRRTRASARLAHGIDRALARVSRGSARHSAVQIALWAGLSVAALALIPRIVIDTDYLSYFDEESPVRRDFEAVNRLLAGAVPIYVVLEAPGEGGFREPAALRALAKLEQRVRDLPGVSHTSSLVTTVRRLHRAIEADDPRAERIPAERGAVAQLLHLVPKGTQQRLATVDHARANLVVRTGEVGSREVLALAARVDAAAQEVAREAGLTASVTGNAILLSRAADGIASGQPRTVGLAALAIFALIAAGLRSFGLGLVALVPNVVPVLLFFGLLGAGAAPLSLPTSLIASVALGIAVDDTVHFLVRYRRERRGGHAPEVAVQRTIASVGRPIVITSAMLCLGYLVIALSGFATLREFGVLSAATMGICIASDLLLLPALLARTRV